MQTVVETPTFLTAAAKAGMTERERFDVVSVVVANPQAGDIIAGGGGVRKIRVPKQGGGKSGGYRILIYYMTENEPVFLISVLNKSKQANLSPVQKSEVKAVAKELRDER
jgi:hypothetical protein